MHKLCTAVYYIHSYGITHRNIKPENILMTTDDDKADIRLVDFSLSKIIGPNEKCNEPYGTLSYCAPEIILDEPYTKAVDIWSIGVVTYLLLSGRLPFNSSDETQIAKNIIYSEVDFIKNPIWKTISSQAKNFVKGLLTKNPDKRMDIKHALEHEWLMKYASTKMTELRRQSQQNNENEFKFYSASSSSKIPK